MQAPCVWIERDENGRPRCEHGWAERNGSRWSCPEKKRLSTRRYQLSEKGRATGRRYNVSEKGRVRRQRYNDSPHAKSVFALNELTRVRV